MIGSGAVIAQFVAGKATRDALFLAEYDVTRLPVMVMGASLFSIVLALLASRAMSRLSPARLLPPAFAVSGALVLVQWSLSRTNPGLTAVLFYLHMLGLGPVLVSGFWSIVSERFDPRTAKRRLGQIAGAATFGGLVASLIADRVAVWSAASSMLPIVAAINLLCAWAVRQLAAAAPGSELARTAPVRAGRAATRSGLRVLAGAPHLRNLAMLVLLGTLGATLLDYVFKARAVTTFGRGDALLRFFALYYGATNVLTFVSQLSLSRLVLERAGLGPAAAAPAASVAGGSLVALFLPGLAPVTAARGLEFVSRMSLFRSAYELLFTPVGAAEKRAAKGIVDVGFDRTGDLLGAGMARVALSVAPASPHAVILAVAFCASTAALVMARRLTSGYVDTLERSLLSQAVRLDLAEVEDLTTRTTMLRTLQRLTVPTEHGLRPPTAVTATPSSPGPAPPPADPAVEQILALRSRNRERILRVLREEQGPSRVLVPHVIPLLAWDPVAPDAVHALRKVVEECLGQLVDSMIDPRQEFAIRRRIARVLSICVSQRAVNGLLLGLDDRFEVRFQCGRSLAAILDRNQFARVEPDRIFEVVLREVSVSRGVWESHRLLDAVEGDEGGLFVDQFIRERAGQSMAHVFTLLSLVLRRDPLQIAFRGLHVDDPLLRGTALEYLESVLPPTVRARLWPFLEDTGSRTGRTRRSREEIVADLVRSNESIMINLAELERRGGGRAAPESGDSPSGRLPARHV
jgi:hypothetical protein